MSHYQALPSELSPAPKAKVIPSSLASHALAESHSIVASRHLRPMNRKTLFVLATLVGFFAAGLLPGCSTVDETKIQFQAGRIVAGDTVASLQKHFRAVLGLPHGDLATGTGNQLMLFLLDMQNQPVSGAEVAATTWIPAHNHGSPDPMVHDMGSGKYHLMNINFSMPGTWEVRVTVTYGGAEDQFTLPFDIGG